MKNFNPTPEQLIATNPAKSVWVSANAGSGKTHVLVERVIRLLLEGADPSTILCITYTKAAASEMSVRLFNRMSNWAIIDDSALTTQLQQLGILNPDANILERARRLFARALETPGGLKIQTIHAFCEKLLQQFPVEASMTPGFKVLDDRVSQNLLATAIEATLNQAAAHINVELATAFSKIVDCTTGDSFEELMRLFLEGSGGLKTVMASNLTAEQYGLVLKSYFAINAEETVNSVAAEILNIDHTAYLQHSKILEGNKLYFGQDVAIALKGIGRPHVSVEALKALFLTQDLDPRKSLIAKQTAKDHPATNEFLTLEQERFLSRLQKHDLLLRIELTANAFHVAKVIYQKVENTKNYSALYDFDDLINKTAKLLSSLNSTQWVLFKLDPRLNHILVDEAQDTSPAQWQIITALCEEFFSGAGINTNADRTIFVVGDRKQSIFSFHGADAQGFADAKAFLSNKIANAGADLAEIDLTISYRSTTKVLEAVDAVFPSNMPARLGFAPDDGAERPHQSNRKAAHGVFEIWPLMEDDFNSSVDVPWTAPVDREPSTSPRRRLAKHIAVKIESWIGKRILKARNQPVMASDILILLQSRGPLFSMIIAELRKIGVKVAGADRLHLQKSLAIQDLLILLQWLVLPQDDYALACLLKSPLVPKPFDDDDLMALAIDRGTQNLWQRLQLSNVDNTNWLLALKEKLHNLGPYAFFSFVLTKFRKAMAQRLGPEAIDASDAFLDQAMAYEIEFGQSLVGFYHWFKSADTSVKREMEKVSNEVRLMTVHGAKGLEANIVILADAATVVKGKTSAPKLLYSPASGDAKFLPLWSVPDLTIHPEVKKWKAHADEKRQAERNRLLYVAMTRACDELYVCGVKLKSEPSPDCWYNLISNSVGPTLAESYDSVLPKQVADNASSQINDPDLPPWATEVAAPEKSQSIFSLTGLIERHHMRDENASKRGTAIHAMLQDLPDIEPPRRAAFVTNRLSRIGLAAEVTKYLALINLPSLEQFWGPNSQAEAELRGVLDDGREVSGRVDRIVMNETEILVLDYKSDRQRPDILALEHPYISQMALYAELLSNAFPNHKIRTALLWTQHSSLEWLNPALLTQNREQIFAKFELEAP